MMVTGSPREGSRFADTSKRRQIPGDLGPVLRRFLTRTDGFFGGLDHLTLSNKLIRRQVAE